MFKPSQRAKTVASPSGICAVCRKGETRISSATWFGPSILATTLSAITMVFVLLATTFASLAWAQQRSLQQLTNNVSQTTPQAGESMQTMANGALARPNYLETSRQITGILDRFMSLGYDKRVRPNYGGPPVEVNVTMRILSISSVSEVMMDFTADFYFRQTWHDPRLSFKKLGDIQTLYVGAEVSKKIWLPDTFFGNEKMAYFHEATTPNVFLRIDHSGEVYRSIRLTVTSSCPMNLQYFPMDRQRCTIEAESYGYNVKDIIYRWARKDTAVERDKEISLPQFDIVQTVQKYRLEELSSGTYSRLIAEIHFARRMGYYLIQIYIPSSLIVVISWVSFWLHRNASPARVQLGVTTVLTMTTLMSSTNAALPKISYVKSIDIFLGTCFVMVFAALLEYATVGYLGKRIAMRKAHAQHAQSQAQARLFAQLQAQAAPTTSTTGEPTAAAAAAQLASLAVAAAAAGNPTLSTSSPTNATSAAAAAAAAAGAPPNIFSSGGSPEFPVESRQPTDVLSSPLAALLRDPNLFENVNALNSSYQTTSGISGNPLRTNNHLEGECCHSNGRTDHTQGHAPPMLTKGATCRHAQQPACAHHNSQQHTATNQNQHQHHLHHPIEHTCQVVSRNNCQHNLNGFGNTATAAALNLASEAPQAPPRKYNAAQLMASVSNLNQHSWCNSCQKRGSQTLPRNLNSTQNQLHEHQHQLQVAQLQQQQQQLQPSSCCHCCCSACQGESENCSQSYKSSQTQGLLAQPVANAAAAAVPNVVLSPNRGASAAATQAAATFVNLHRKNKGLPPSTNPNFAQFNSIINPPYNRRLEIIFGIRPSDIDKYSRVVFPVCFVCFQLMYWIVYLHISAFLEPDQQSQQQLQLQQQHQQQQQQQLLAATNLLQPNSTN